MVRLAAALLVGIVAAGLGISRLMPGVGYWDTAEFQTIPPILGTAHPTGYPTYVILGWIGSAVLTPFGEAAYRMNLLSALFVGAAAAVTVDLVRLLTRSLLLGVVAGLALATTPLVWSIATHADPHALHLLFLVGLLWLLARWEDARRVGETGADGWLFAAAAVTGLSVGNHSLTLLLGLPILLFVLAVDPQSVRRPRTLVGAIAAFAIAATLVYLELPLRSGWLPAPLVYGRPDTWEGFWYVALGEQFRGGIGDPFGNLPGKIADVVELAVRELGALAPLVFAGFAVTAVRRPAFGLLSGSTMLITLFFNAAYVNADIERYYLGPALIAWVWLAMLAAAVVDAIAAMTLEPPLDEDPVDRDHRGHRLGGEEEPPGGPPRRRLDPWRLAALGLMAVLLLIPTAAGFGARAQAVDRTTDRAAERWVDDALAALEPDAVVVSWWSYSTPLWYAQHIQGRRLDVFVVDDRTRIDQNLGEIYDVIEANLGRRPVYAIRIDPLETRTLRERYRLEAVSAALNVFRVLPRGEPAAAAAP